MIKVDYPIFEFKIKGQAGKEIIFDEMRKLWVRLTPEEWVRQNMLQYLLQTLQYPASLIAVEKELKIGELKKRFDILVYNTKHKPWLMIECKAMDIKLADIVLQQILRYNMAAPVAYLFITNGTSVYGWDVQNDCKLMDGFPVFS
ncbi:MAG: type I restriction enzyme HsdR N-terminal domain-containing protein [Deinococcales bacterium]|nr:type I restriction enzyme HsdR N-terminal domain-containing protein [Chitinophagaceae bacterium]